MLMPAQDARSLVPGLNSPSKLTSRPASGRRIKLCCGNHQRGRAHPRRRLAGPCRSRRRARRPQQSRKRVDARCAGDLIGAEAVVHRVPGVPVHGVVASKPGITSLPSPPNSPSLPALIIRRRRPRWKSRASAGAATATREICAQPQCAYQVTHCGNRVVGMHSSLNLRRRGVCWRDLAELRQCRWGSSLVGRRSNGASESRKGT